MTEKLSSLMDGELAAGEAGRAIDECCASEKAKVDWHIYHVIGDAMRGQSPRTLAIPTQVMRALQAQPTVLAPRRMPRVTFQRVALAAAASVATVGVVGWIGSQQGASTSVGVPVAAKPGSAIQPVSNTVPVREATTLEVQTYLNAHRQLPTPEQYPVQKRAPAAAAAR